MRVFNRKETRIKRSTLRKQQTDAERLLWSKIRNRQLNNHKVVRQFGIGPYIADFYCSALKLVIELDGGQHFTADGIARDKEREDYMNCLGIKTVRFTNTDVVTNIDGVLSKIAQELL